MISDVLFEAREEIERYQKDMPDVYGDLESTVKIEAVKLVMKAVQGWFDTPRENSIEGN